MFLVLGNEGGDEDVPELLVHRLCKFALRTLNSDMGYLFEKFVPVFDQERGEMHEQGETHAQYAAYQEYVSVLEQHLVRFVAEEGYGGGDAAGFLATLRQQVAEDAANVELQFQKTWETMKTQLGDLSELGADSEEFLEQLREFYRPPTVQDLMQTVLNMTEYETFSHLMRAKVMKVKRMQEMQRRKDEMMNGEMGLAHRFIEFATKVLNSDLEPFYDKCLPLFSQDAAEFEQQGHTLEQYAAFQEFIVVAEGHFNMLIAREGFDGNAIGFITELQRLAQKDQERLDAELKKAIAEVQRRAGGDGVQPVMMICKPRSLADLINYFTRYTEYETFSSMMRERAAELALVKQLFASLADGRQYQSLDDGEVQPLQLNDVPSEPLNFAPPNRGAQDGGYAQPALDGGYANSTPAAPLDAYGQNATSSTAQSLSVTVPEGCPAGSQLSVPTPDGQMLLATVPEGLMPGMTFEVCYEPMQASGAAVTAQMLSVTVPEGCFGGSQLTVPTPDGQALLATIPDGLMPGMLFQVSYTPLQ